MMKYALDPLIKVRQLRQDNALNEQIKAQRLLEQAQQELVQQAQALETYRAWRPQEEKRLYDQVLHKSVKRDALDDLKAQVAGLREQELGLEKKLSEAQKAVEQAEKNLQTAKQAYIQAMKELDKIKEHRSLEEKKWNRTQERKADTEMEDFKGRKPG